MSANGQRVVEWCAEGEKVCMGCGKFLVLLLSCWQIGDSSAVQAAGENSVLLAQGTVNIVERNSKELLEPCTMRIVSTVLRGGRRIYLNLLLHTVLKENALNVNTEECPN